MKPPFQTKLYYGWVITITLAITETISWGIVFYAFTVFITPMEAELGWSRGQLTGAFSLALLITGAVAYPVGAWIDKHGARWLMTIGSIGASLLVIAWSQVTNLTSLYLIWAGLGLCAAAVLYDPAFAVVAIWFERRRSQALAVITFAAGLASTIFIPLSDYLLNAMGRRQAVFSLGILLACTTILPHALILRRRPSDLGLVPDGEPLALGADGKRPSPPISISLRDALSGRTFWLITAAFGLTNLAAAAIRVHFIPFLIDGGINASTAAYASGSIGIMQVAGRAIFAPLDSRFSGKTMVIGVFALQAAALITLMFGAAYGARTLARPSIVAELYGVAYYGRISSIMSTVLIIASTIAPVGAGLLYDWSGDYGMVIWLTLLFTILGIGMMLFLRPDLLRRPTSVGAQIN